MAQECEGSSLCTPSSPGGSRTPLLGLKGTQAEAIGQRGIHGDSAAEER